MVLWGWKLIQDVLNAGNCIDHGQTMNTWACSLHLNFGNFPKRVLLSPWKQGTMLSLDFESTKSNRSNGILYLMLILGAFSCTLCFASQRIESFVRFVFLFFHHVLWPSACSVRMYQLTFEQQSRASPRGCMFSQAQDCVLLAIGRKPVTVPWFVGMGIGGRNGLGWIPAGGEIGANSGCKFEFPYK